MSPDRPIVLVVGAASRDVVEDDPRGWRLGGAVLFCSLALARFGFEVRAVVGADRDAAAARELELLRSAGVAMAIAELASGPVFNNVTHLLHSTADKLPLAALPRGWTSRFDGVLFAPVAAEISEDWATLAAPGVPGSRPAGPVVGLGWQGLLRVLVAGESVRPSPPVAPALARVADIVVMSREDALPGATPDQLAAHLAPGATLVWTEGASGGHVLEPAAERGGRAPARTYPAIPSDAVRDPTGAGDVFLAGLLAATIRPSLAAPYDRFTFAAAAASLVVEGPGLEGVPDLAAALRRATRAPSLARRLPSDDSSRAIGRPSQA